ncbi:MAG: hypothetical protein KAR19_16865 [Bacteroidales bacterium]|nr:hypothetical protein [Bacteroidales bacterium]
MYVSNWLFLLLMFQPIVCGAVSDYTLTVPFPAHAHNDYNHEHPLFDALENGFRSIEADVFSMGDSLYVAHDRKDIKQGFAHQYQGQRIDYLQPVGPHFE